jgi:hypothetical protein
MMTLDAALDKVTSEVNAIADREAITLMMRLVVAGASDAEVVAAMERHRKIWTQARHRAEREVRAVVATGVGVQ